MRKIIFKCVDSQFFSTFDGEWKVEELPSLPTDPPSTRVSYSVDVRPKGVVPVLALEWRIREDVPTNLRSVKLASEETGYEGVRKLRGGGEGWGNNSNSGVGGGGGGGDGKGSSSVGSAGVQTGSTVGDNVQPVGSTMLTSYTSPSQSTRARMRESAKSRVKDFVGRFGPRRYEEDLGEWEEEETMAAYNKKNKQG